MNAINSRAGETSRHQLQMLPGSLIYGQQRSAGLVRLSGITVRLPVR